MTKEEVIYEQNNYSTVVIAFIIFKVVVYFVLTLISFWSLNIFLIFTTLILETLFSLRYFMKKPCHLLFTSSGISLIYPITGRREIFEPKNVVVVNKGDRYAYNSSGNFMFHIRVISSGKEKTVAARSLNEKESIKFIKKLDSNGIYVKNEFVYN
ncbi:MAG: hypothetical protein KDC84_11155 [Crocinitomicaceae bacterium]|nr:hypothetical protein [Crocinitomicaceae bacterium]